MAYGTSGSASKTQQALQSMKYSEAAVSCHEQLDPYLLSCLLTKLYIAELACNSPKTQIRQQSAPVLVFLRDLDSQGIADSRIQQATKLAEAIQGQHNDSSQQATKELSKNIHESGVPIAVEDDGGAKNSSRVQRRSCELPTCI